MKVLVSGASGLIGTALLSALAAEGHAVARFTRKEGAGSGDVRWDPARGTIDQEGLDRFAPEAVIHLAGENIAARRWTEAHKRAVRESRVLGTQLLCGALARIPSPPAALLSASAVGYYGNRGDRPLDERSGPGEGFLPEVCLEWEASTRAASDAGIRVVHLRTGIVLDAREGALARMLPVFRLGLGGRLGDGRQYMSWIALEDHVAAVRFLLREASISGPVNLVAPEPADNAAFTRTLARVLSRPALLAVPAFALRLAFGEMADALLLSGARVLPERLLAAGFSFRHPSLEAALRAILRR